MGIPSYFNHVLKNHTKIIKRLNQHICHELFIDANSIIYDVVKQSEENINQRVYDSIIELITKLNPRFTLVAFDGVAPLAKMKQQKQRRYKSWVTKQIIPSNNWNTNAITPGTKFMNELDLFLEEKFKINKPNVLFSGTNVQGEGEHKIMEYIRNNKNGSNQMIYGLDADLIMLGLLHLKYNENLFLYRETKHFSYLKHIDINTDYVFNMNEMANQISEYIELPKVDAINNYCFLCYLFGNDFLPHFPSLNIRNHGIQYLLELYKLNKHNLMLIKDNKIQWNAFKKLCIELSKTENERIQANIVWKRNIKTTPLNKEEELNNLPVKDMIRENYLSLHLDKYNKILLGQDPEQPCKNYLKMLEWTWSYYSGVCKDHYICYEFNIAPLFKDIIDYIPCFNEEVLEYNKTPPPLAISQLIYVLPYQDFHLVPIDTTKIINKFPHLTDTQFKIHYDFCKFFWESQVEFNYISFNELNVFCRNTIND
jgi:5'-3' exonuclease